MRISFPLSFMATPKPQGLYYAFINILLKFNLVKHSMEIQVKVALSVEVL